jgi:hypothetical protein
VLPVHSRKGPEGPPRPYGLEPKSGAPPAPSSPALAAAQSRALLEGPFPAGGLTRGISEGTLLFEPSRQVRETALARIRASGARIVRIPVEWRFFVASRPTAGFDARDPASPDYDFTALDGAVTEAVAAGLRPLLVISHAPEFAEAPNRWRYAYPGSWDPSPLALEAFAAALARRYDGSFADPAAPGGVLPAVRLFQAWNEPNLARYLEPQWVARGAHWQAFSPLLYRELLNGFYAGIKAVAPQDLVLAAGVAPNGDQEGVGRMAPLRFLRALLCLTPPGRAPRREPCAEPPHFDALAFHPLSVGNPDIAADSSLDVSIADAGKITSVLAAARRLGTALPSGPKPVWVTELNWESAPQAAHGVPARLQAAWISRALHRLWVAGVSTVMWQFLIDPYPGVTARTPEGGTFQYPRPAGLYSAGLDGDPESAQPKRFLTGFSLPFDPLRLSPRLVRLWALADDPLEALRLQRRRRDGAWQTLAGLRADSSGVLNVLIAMRGAQTLRLVEAGRTSATASVGRLRARL